MPLSGEYEPSTLDWARANAEQIMASGGTEGMALRGMAVVLLTTVGAKTGKLRKTPLMRVEHDGEYALVASKGGDPRNPAWYENLVADPHIMIQDGPQPYDFTVREVSGEERDIWWERSVAVYPPYAEYAQKAGRLIPVLVATRS